MIDQSETIPNSNSSKNLDADGNPIYPSTYEFEEIMLIKREGGGNIIQKSIIHLVTSFNIVEELFSPLLTGKISIRDNENFFEKFRLDGQEIINVKIKYLKDTSSNSYETLQHQFVVKDYPQFSKTGESINVQEYEMTLVSSYAYLSRLQQISFGVNTGFNTPIETIRDIFKVYLGNPKFDYPATPEFGPANGRPCVVNKFKAVITLRTPLQAIEWLRSNCYDTENSPFFIYTTLQDNSIIAKSWADIITDTNPAYYPLGGDDPYSIKPFGEAEPGTPEYLKELKTKIINLNSNIKLDKLSQAVAGGIGTAIEVIDLENRSYLEERVQPGGENQRESLGGGNFYTRDKVTFNGDVATVEMFGLPNVGSTFTYLKDEEFGFDYLRELKINGKRPEIVNSILENPRASQELCYLPVSPYGSDYKASAAVKLEFLKDSKLYKANMETETHNISTYGDPNLKAGTKIEIAIPKAVDTSKEDPGKDERLSGLYIIAVSVHSFQGGVYTNQLKIIRDGGISRYNQSSNQPDLSNT